MADQEAPATAAGEKRSYKDFMPEWARDPKFEPAVTVLSQTILPIEERAAKLMIAMGVMNEADFVRANTIFSAVQLGSVVAMIDVTGTDEDFERNLAEMLKAAEDCARDARPAFVAKRGKDEANG